MAYNGAVIDIPLTSDVEGFIANIKSQLKKTNQLGLEVDTSNLEKALQSFLEAYQKIANTKLNTSTFVKAQETLSREIDNLRERTDALETGFAGLISVMEKTDGGKFASEISEIKQAMSDLNTITISTTNAISSLNNKENNISALQQTVVLLKEIQSLNDKKVGDVKVADNFKTAKKELINLFNEITKKKKELTSIEVVSDEDKQKVASLQKELTEMALTWQKMYSINSESFEENFTGAIVNMGETKKTFENLSDIVDNTITSIRNNVESNLSYLENSLKTVTGINELNNGASVSVNLATTTKGLIDQLQRLLESVQPYLDKNPLEVNVSIATEWGTRRNKELLKQFQTQIANLSENTNVEEFSKIYEDIQKSFGNEINLKFKSNFDEEQKAIRAGVVALKSEIGKKFELNPKISKEAVTNLQTQLDKLSNKLVLSIDTVKLTEGAIKDAGTLWKNEEDKLTLSADAISSIIDAMISSSKELNNQLAPIWQLLSEIKDVLNQYPIDSIVDSSKELVRVIQQAFSILSQDDLNNIFAELQKRAESISGSLRLGENQKELKSLLVAFREYQELGGKRSLFELGGNNNVQQWFKRNKDIVIETTQAVEELDKAEKEVSNDTPDTSLFDTISSKIDEVTISIQGTVESLEKIKTSLDEIKASSSNEKILSIDTESIEKITLAIGNLQDAIEKIQTSLSDGTIFKGMSALTPEDADNISKVVNALSEMANVMPSGDFVNNISKIRSFVNSFSKEKGIERIEKAAEGVNKLREALDGEVSSNSLLMIFQKISESADISGVLTELKALLKVETAANQAAIAKKEFSEANKKMKESADESSVSVEKEKVALEKIVQKLDDLNQSKFMPEYLEQIEQIKIAMASMDDTVDGASESYKQLAEQANKLWKEKGFPEWKKAAESSIASLEAKIAKFTRNNTAMSSDFKKQIDNIRKSITTNMSIEEVSNLATQFKKLEAAINDAGQTGASFFDTLKKRAMGVNAQLIAQYLSWQDIIRYIRQAVDVIKELDYELVDLKKTTTMSNDELKEFYYIANDTAKVTGVTTKEIISQAAAWSRLGYSEKDAVTEMSALSSQFAQISPGMSVDTAVDGLVSTMKAFHVEVADVETEIMDVINRAGNTMATSNEEIVEMLTRSSAAMSAANNTIKETVALESAAVQITRNAETTGTAFRTMSMRIRGYDEETEEYIGDVEELTGKIADLTKTAKTPGGISLFTDETKTTYKSTYQILKDISEIYNDLTDADQAALLETLAGKRGGQVLAGLLEDFSEVERAMSEVQQSAGSADNEMAIVEESLVYKINRLKETWVGVLQELIDSGKLGKIIDFLTAISEILGKIITTQGPFLTLIEGLGLRKLILNLEKIPPLLSTLQGVLNGFSKTEIFLGETEDAINGIGLNSLKATKYVKGLQTVLLAIAKNPITWIAIAIGAGVIAFDALTDSVEETQIAIDETKDKISKISSEIKSLEDLGSERTKAQDTRLDNLKDELELQERILAIEEKRQYAELYGNKFSDYFDKDNYNAKYLAETNRQNPDSIYRTIDLYNRADKQWANKITNRASYQKEVERLQKIDTVGMSSEEKRQLEEQIESYLLLIQEVSDEIDKLSDKKLTIKGDILEKKDEYQTIIDSTRQLIEDGKLQGTALKNAEQVIKDYEYLLQVIEEVTPTETAMWKAAKVGAIEAKKATEEYNESLAKNEDSTIVDSIEGINQRLKPQFDELGELYQSIFYGEDGEFSLNKITTEQLEGIKKAFLDMENERGEKIGDAYVGAREAVNEFIDVITSAETKSKSLAEQQKIVQDAVNKLATKYFYAADGLGELNEETADALKQMFKSMGIANADEIVDYYLNLKVNKLSEDEAKAALKEVGIDDPTQRQIDYYINLNLTTDHQDTKNKINELYAEMDKLGEGGGVDLRLRPKVESQELEKAGWEAGEGVATVFTSTFQNEAGDVAINLTPIATDENGNVIDILSPDELKEYADRLLAGLPDDKNLQIGMKFEGEDAINKAEDAAEKVHEIQDVFYNLNIDTVYDELNEEISGLWDEFEKDAKNGEEVLESIKDSLDDGFGTEELEHYGEILGLTTQQLADFLFKEQLIDSASIDTSQECAQLLALAGDAKYTEEVYQKLLELLEIYTGIESGVYGQGTEDRAKALARASELKKEIEELVALGPDEKEITVKPPKDTTKRSGGSDKDPYVEAYKKEKEELQSLRDAGLISEREYLDRLKALIDKFFKDRADYAKNYIDEMKDYLDGMKSLYDSALSGVTTLLDKKITAANKGKEAAISALEAEKEAAEEAYQAQIDAIQEEIDALDDLIDKKNEDIDALNEQIDAINKANEARDRAITLQQAEYNLQRSMNQRTKLVYTGEPGQMVYERDEAAVRENQESLRDAQDEIAKAKIQDQIDLIEKEIKEIEKQKKLLQDQQEELQKAMDETSKYYEKLIKEQEKYWDSIIKGLENQKSKWEELAEIESVANAYAAIEQVFGKLGYTVEEVLNGDEAAFEAFKNDYLRLLSEMNSGNQPFLDGLDYAVKGAKGAFGEISESAGEVEGAMDKIAQATAPLSDAATNIEAVGTAASGATTGVSSFKSATDGISDNLEKINDVSFDKINDALADVKEKIDDIVDAISGSTSLVSALENLNDENLLSGISKAFETLAASIDSVASALGAGGGSSTLGSEGDSTSSSSASMSAGADEGQSGGSGEGLVGAIENIKKATDSYIGTDPGSEGDNAVGAFFAMKESVDNVSKAIGIGDESGESAEETLSAAITEIQPTTNESLYGGGGAGEGAIPAFEDFKHAIEECLAVATELLEIIQQLSEMELPTFSGGEGHYSGTAYQHYEGTAKLTGDWGVRKGGKSLVGELGQELVIRRGHFFTVGDHGPEQIQLQRGDVVLNHLQTREILNKRNVIVPKNSLGLASGSVLSPITSFALSLGSTPTMSGIRDVIADQTSAIQQTLGKLVPNGSTKPNVTINYPSFVVSGITGEQVMRQIEGSFEGLMLNAYQKATS